MGLQSSKPDEPYLPSEYSNDEDIPFAPDGNSPLIASHVELVKGVSGRFKGLRCVRKTVIQDADTGDDDSLKRQLMQEAKILQSARHVHVVQLVHSYFQSRAHELRFSIVMDRADTNLNEFLKPGNVPEKQLFMKWFGCLVSVVRHIHSSGIRHRDIKPRNILIKNSQVLLADFGISQMGLGKTIPTTNLARNASRTKEYCAPEVDQGRTRGRSADIFSLGAVFLEMTVAHFNSSALFELENILKPGQNPSYAKNIERIHKWRKGRELEPDNDATETSMLCLCRKMLHPDRFQRPLAQDLGLLDFLVCHCSDICQRTKEHRLIEACACGAANDVHRLLDMGADPNSLGAIHQAADRGFVDIVRLLLRCGVCVHSLNPARQTPLHCAARNGHERVVKELLENHSCVDARDENEQTALHGAAAHGYMNVVRLLLQAGADGKAEDLDGNCARHFAGRQGHLKVLQLIDNWPARSRQGSSGSDS